MIVPKITRVTILKATPSTKLGIGVKTAGDGRLVVSSMEPDSQCQLTDLEVGNEILAINDESSIDDARHAVCLIQGAVGTVTILATSAPLPPMTKLAVISIGNSGQSPGIQFSLIRRCLLRVSHISDESPFFDTNLCVGDICLSVNNVLVGHARHAKGLLRPEQDGYLTIWFLSMQHFRNHAIESIVNRACTYQWTSADTCHVRNYQWKRSVAFTFEKNETCRIPDRWEYLSKKNTSIFHQEAIFNPPWYQHASRLVEQLNDFISQRLNVFQDAIQYAQDYVPEAIPLYIEE